MTNVGKNLNGYAYFREQIGLHYLPESEYYYCLCLLLAKRGSTDKISCDSLEGAHRSMFFVPVVLCLS